MKKLFFLIAMSLSCFIASAQDSTAATITDSIRMYTYKNVYISINSINVWAPGSIRGPKIASTDSSKWMTAIVLGAYTSKADYKAGKPELFIINTQILVTDKFPTQLEILNRMRQYIK